MWRWMRSLTVAHVLMGGWERGVKVGHKTLNQAETFEK